MKQLTGPAVPLLLVGPEASAFLRLKRLMSEIGLVEANAPPDAVIDIAESLMTPRNFKLLWKRYESSEDKKWSLTLSLLISIQSV